MTTYEAIPCPCGRRECANWHVDVVGVRRGGAFTESQALVVAAVLNAIEFNPAKRTPEQRMIDQCVAYIIGAATAKEETK